MCRDRHPAVVLVVGKCRPPARRTVCTDFLGCDWQRGVRKPHGLCALVERAGADESPRQPRRTTLAPAHRAAAACPARCPPTRRPASPGGHSAGGSAETLGRGRRCSHCGHTRSSVRHLPPAGTPSRTPTAPRRAHDPDALRRWPRVRSPIARSRGSATAPRPAGCARHRVAPPAPLRAPPPTAETAGAARGGTGRVAAQPASRPVRIRNSPVARHA